MFEARLRVATHRHNEYGAAGAVCTVEEQLAGESQSANLRRVVSGVKTLCSVFAGWPVLLILLQYWQAFATFNKGKSEAQSSVCRTSRSSSSVNNSSDRVQ